MTDHSVSHSIDFADFTKVDIRAGTILDAHANAKARNPAYVLEIDFGPILGIKRSSAQLTETYSAQELIGCQIVAVVNFEPKRVAGIVSEVLVLAVVQPDGPTALLSPTMPVENGSRIA